MTSRLRFLQVSAVSAVSALVLSGCAGGDGADAGAGEASPEPESSTSPLVEPLPSTTVKIPKSVNLTPPGTTLDFRATATVAHEVKDQGSVLALTVESATQGSLKDFVGFDLDDPYKRRGNYYYVRVTVENAGTRKLAGVPVPLWGVSGTDTLLRPVAFKSAFKECPTEPLPEDFRPGDRLETCLVFLSPDHGSLEGVSYRPTSDYVPIEWHGKVKLLPEKKDDKPGKGGKAS